LILCEIDQCNMPRVKRHEFSDDKTAFQ
jgi:hypothetical protein